MLKESLIAVAALGLVAVPAMAGNIDFMKEFPQAGVYTIYSLPSFNIVVGDRTEVLTCEAELVLRTGTPYVSDEGFRQVDLEIIDWHATGSSELLGEVTFRMIEGDTPDQSYVRSYQIGDRDFPAHAQFAVMYELETQFGTVSGLYGLTEGSIRAFPPANDLFTMEKGDTAALMAALMPEPVSALSAAGEVTPVNVTVRPVLCACPTVD